MMLERSNSVKFIQFAYPANHLIPQGAQLPSNDDTYL